MSNKWFITQPDDVYEKKLVVPRDTDLLIKITCRVFDEDCDPTTQEAAFDFTGHTCSLEIFQNKYDTTALFTILDADFVKSADADGITEGVLNVLEVTIDWDDVIAQALPLGVELWYRVYNLDAASVPYVPQRGPILFERY